MGQTIDFNKEETEEPFLTHPLPDFNARKIREASTPTFGLKPLRDTAGYIRSLIAREKIPTTTMGYALIRAVA
jgi:hypothetical protein